MTFQRWRDGLWLGLNLAGAVLFLALSSTQWLEPELRNDPSAAVGGLNVVPFFILVAVVGPLLLLNLVWLGVALWKAASRQDATPSLIFFGMGVVWIGLILFNSSMM